MNCEPVLLCNGCGHHAIFKDDIRCTCGEDIYLTEDAIFSKDGRIYEEGTDYKAREDTVSAIQCPKCKNELFDWMLCDGDEFYCFTCQEAMDSED